MPWPFFSDTDRAILLDNNKMLRELIRKVNNIMADTTALEASLQTLQSTVDEAANAIDTLVAAGTGASQEQIDALNASVQASTATLRTAIDNAEASLPNQINPL